MAPRRKMSLRIPTVKLKIPGKAFLKSESSGSGWDLASPLPLVAKVKNYNLNVTEVRDSDFKMLFPEFSISPSGS